GKVKEVLGYTAQELIGKTPFDLMSEEEAVRVGQILKELTAEKKPIIDLEKWNITKNGKLVCMQTTGVPLLGEKGQLIGYRGVDKNITEKKRAEESLRLTNQELTILKDELSKLNQDLERKVQERTKEIGELLRQKDEFISQLGHDLKTPLSVILNVLPMIQEETSNKNLQKDCEIAMRNSNYINNLVTETLKIAELSSPNIKFNMKPLALVDVVREVIASRQFTFDEKNITFINNVKENLVVSADRLRVGELLINIITNALKYTPCGGTITINATQKDNEATICITDTGVGISRSEINGIFNEFYKVDKSRHEINSCGLGLSICKRIVEKHGGKIWAESPGPGKGTTLCFTLECGKNGKEN
ncbi:MAG: PAS domain S-box protein, partial [Candidatus Thermoplasmatota archaeon]|nr:PAS domain S-box protein [Candidatus Thermoplasmatota archaeon]